jgi:hypothetical protein
MDFTGTEPLSPSEQKKFEKRKRVKFLPRAGHRYFTLMQHSAIIFFYKSNVN